MVVFGPVYMQIRITKATFNCKIQILVQRFYAVVYGSPCGRPEKVCWFILPWLALRRTWMTRRFGQVDCPSSGSWFHVWTFINSIDLQSVIWEAELMWAHMHSHQSAVCIHKCWLSVHMWLAAPSVHRFCLDQLALLPFFCMIISNSNIKIAITIWILLLCENTQRLFSHESNVHNFNFNSKCAFWITQCTHERPNLGFCIPAGEECPGTLPIKHAQSSHFLCFCTHAARGI